MRAQPGTPEVTAFWTEIDRLVLARERIYLLPTDAVAVAPESLQAPSVQTRGYRETAQLALRGNLARTAVEELEAILRQAVEQLPGVDTAELGQNLALDHAVGHYTDRAAAEAARSIGYRRQPRDRACAGAAPGCQ